ncbi:toxin C-terminal domain-containing protein, partial [Streptomyces sp. NPDC006356]
TVTAEITGEGLKDLVNVTLTVGGREVQVTATDGHPFWVPGLDDWIDAGDLRAGQALRTATGKDVRISAVEHRTVAARVHNLTVADAHTYYVLVGATPVLVHNSGNANCNPLPRKHADDIAKFLGYKKTKKLSAGDTHIWENKKAGPGQPRYITYDRTGHKGGIFKGASFPNPFQSTKDSARDGTYDLDIDANGMVVGLKWIAK